MRGDHFAPRVDREDGFDHVASGEAQRGPSVRGECAVRSEGAADAVHRVEIGREYEQVQAAGASVLGVDAAHLGAENEPRRMLAATHGVPLRLIGQLEEAVAGRAEAALQLG